eukprot:5655652-Alexandrium_andersonii.AAC.1
MTVHCSFGDLGINFNLGPSGLTKTAGVQQRFMGRRGDRAFLFNRTAFLNVAFAKLSLAACSE